MTSILQQLLPIAFTTTSIYVVFIVFLLDKYIELYKRNDPVTGIFFGGSIVVLLAFGLGGVATGLLLGIELQLAPVGWVKTGGYMLGVSIMVLFVGTLGIAIFVLREYQP